MKQILILLLALLGSQVDSQKVEDIAFYRKRKQKYTDLLVNFYNENRHNYIVLKNGCLLDSIQKAYIIGISDIIRTYRYEGEDLYISNTPDYYTIMSENETYTLYDPYKKLKEYIELRKTLNVQYPPGTRHYVDGKLVIEQPIIKKK